MSDDVIRDLCACGQSATTREGEGGRDRCGPCTALRFAAVAAQARESREEAEAERRWVTAVCAAAAAAALVAADARHDAVMRAETARVYARMADGAEAAAVAAQAAAVAAQARAVEGEAAADRMRGATKGKKKNGRTT